MRKLALMLSIILFILGGLHQYLFTGTNAFIQVRDILHHEFIMFVILSFGVGVYLGGIKIKCKYATDCPYYRVDAVTCQSYTAEGGYCGKYREFQRWDKDECG